MIGSPWEEACVDESLPAVLDESLPAVSSVSTGAIVGIAVGAFVAMLKHLLRIVTGNLPCFQPAMAGGIGESSAAFMLRIAFRAAGGAISLICHCGVVVVIA